MASAEKLRLRLFLEGLEVPVIAAVVQATPNSPAAASIQIPPLPEATRFLPRTLVHLFFFDARDAGGIRSRAHRRTRPEPRPPRAHAEALPDLPDPDTEARDAEHLSEKLLFCGEVVGFTYTKNAASRSLVLQCLDLSNYWDHAYQWQNTDLFGPGVKALFSGGSTNLFTDFLTDEGSVITRIIQTPSVQYPRLKGLLGGLIHLLEAIGGSYYGKTQFAGQNIFFSIAELRLHITQMITAYEDDPTASRLLNAEGYDSLFGRTLGGLGSQVSIRNAINALMSVIFHETYAVPTARYVPGSAGTVSGQTRRRLAQDPKNGFIAQRAEALVTSLTELTSSLREGLLASSTPADRSAELGPRLELARNQCTKTLGQIRDPAVQRTRAYFTSAQKSLDQARTQVRARRGGLSTEALAPILRLLDAAVTELRRVAEYELTTDAKSAIPARLNSHIFRPDIWFGAPPKCNVLFPEQYTSLTYARSFLEETTRFLLKTNSEFFGEDELFDQFYFAPKGPSLKRDQASLASILSNDLLDHELCTGIVPTFEKMGELNIFAARSGTVQSRMPKIGLAQRSANFLYFKYRFAARRFELSARFSPQIAPGFPGLVIDRYMDVAAAKRRRELMEQLGAASPTAAKLTGTHFLANFTEVTHSVDQGQGRTEIRGSYARQAEESVEFLGIDRSQTVQRRAPEKAVRSTDVAALAPPRPLSIGPNAGTILRTTDVTDTYRARDLETGQKLPVFGGRTSQGSSTPRPRVPVGVSAPARAYGPDVVALVGDAEATVTFRAYRIEEEVARYEKDAVDLPAEEYIRPGWYGDIWHPAQIGKAYEQFFETGAITDAISVGDPAAATPTGPESAFTLASDASIETAVAFLVELYSHIRREGLDVEEFIAAYTWRPIATLVDMFGSSDLRLSSDGHEVLQGVEGFHSKAFGPYSDLFGLVRPDIDTVLGIRRGSVVAQRGDMRQRKQDAVRDYLGALQFARAILG